MRVASYFLMRLSSLIGLIHGKMRTLIEYENVHFYLLDNLAYC